MKHKNGLLKNKQTWIDNGCHHHVFTQEELIIQSVGRVTVISPLMGVICARIVIEFSRFVLIHQQGPADWFTCLRVLIHGIVDVLNKFVPQLNVLSTDCGNWFFIAVWLLVRLVVVIIVVSKPRKKRSHYGPARQHLGIHNLALPCCTEAPNVTAGDRLRR